MAEQIILSGQFDLENVYRRCADAPHSKTDPIKKGGFTFWPDEHSKANIQFWATGKININTGEYGDPVLLIQEAELLVFVSEASQSPAPLRLEDVLIQNRTKTRITEATLRKALGHIRWGRVDSSSKCLDSVVQLEAANLRRIYDAMSPEAVARRHRLYNPDTANEEDWEKVMHADVLKFFGEILMISLDVPLSFLPGMEEPA